MKTSKTKNARLLDDEDENARDPETPFGQKKRMANQMAKMYHPRAVEKSCVLFFSPLNSTDKLFLVVSS